MSTSDFQEICGLWESTSKTGREYIGGKVGDQPLTIPAGSRVFIFPNQSDNPKAPAFRALFTPPDGEQQRTEAAPKGAFNKYKQEAAAPAPAAAAEEEFDDNVPF